MPRKSSLSLIHTVTALFMTIAVLASANSRAMTIEGNKVLVEANNATLYVSAYRAPVLCSNGGIKLTAVGEYAVDIVSLYCLNEAQVDKLIKGLQQAKSESAKLKALSNP